MKRIVLQFSAVVMVAMLALASCGKDNTTTTPTTNNTPQPNNPQPNNPTTNTDSVSTTKTCYDGSGSLTISNMGFTGFSCNLACAVYLDVSHLWPGTYQTTITIANQTGFGQLVNFVFNGKSFPKSGTYKAVTMYGMMSSTHKLADDEVVVHIFGPKCTKTEQNNTVTVVNDNGKITFTSSKLELFDLIGEPASVITELNVTKSTSKK